MNSVPVEHDQAASVYQYFDANGVLLYVGMTSRGDARNVEHNKSKDWWPHVASQSVSHFGSRATALEVERELISAFAPPFNVQHNARHEQARSHYLRKHVSVANVLPPDLYRMLGRELPLHTVKNDKSRQLLTLASSPAHWAITGNMRIGSVIRVLKSDNEVLGRIVEHSYQGRVLVLVWNYGKGADTSLPVSAAVRMKSVPKPMYFDLRYVRQQEAEAI